MYRGFAITDRGTEKPLNDDKVMFGNTVLSAGSAEFCGEAPVIAAVFDGVSAGGHGAEASNIATAAMIDYCERAKRASSNRSTLDDEPLDEVFTGIHEELLSYRRSIGSSEPVATTVSGISIGAGHRIQGFNSGDSRVYRFRDGMLVQMTVDHTVVQGLIENGADNYLVDQAEEANGHVITKALGVPSEANVVDLESFGEFQPGDIYLGCTDGLSGFLDRDVIKRVLSRKAPLPIAGKTLFDIAIHNGSYDNVSLFLITLEEDASLQNDSGDSISIEGNLLQE